MSLLSAIEFYIEIIGFLLIILFLQQIDNFIIFYLEIPFNFDIEIIVINKRIEIIKTAESRNIIK